MRLRRKSEDFVSNPGDPIHVIYSPHVLPSGEVELVESGTEDLNAYIQSFKESTDIMTIMSRVRQGEIDLLNKRPGSFGDFTKMPKTYAEVLQLQINSKNLFNSLSPEMRRSFDNDANIFLASAGTAEWYEKMADVLPVEVLEQVVPKQFKAAQAAAESKESEVKSYES